MGWTVLVSSGELHPNRIKNNNNNIIITSGLYNSGNNMLTEIVYGYYGN